VTGNQFLPPADQESAAVELEMPVSFSEFQDGFNQFGMYSPLLNSKAPVTVFSGE
jgi:hypothetical protein